MSDDDDRVPISVRLGEVVPPEDPEDWTRPLTWVAALGMLAGPLVAFAWFAIGPPTQSAQAVPATYLVALGLAGGAAATGATQQGTARAAAATLGAGLFGALVIVVLGAVMAGERQVGVASPTLAHAVGGTLGGLGGTAVASLLAGLIARVYSRGIRFVLAAVAGGAVGLIIVSALMSRVAGG